MASRVPNPQDQFSSRYHHVQERCHVATCCIVHYQMYILNFNPRLQYIAEGICYKQTFRMLNKHQVLLLIIYNPSGVGDGNISRLSFSPTHACTKTDTWGSTTFHMDYTTCPKYALELSSSTYYARKLFHCRLSPSFSH